MSFLSELINVRFREEEIKKLDKFISENPYKYESRSHVIRVAVMQFINKENETKQ